jgi:hypothetical protein
MRILLPGTAVVRLPPPAGRPRGRRPGARARPRPPAQRPEPCRRVLTVGARCSCTQYRSVICGARRCHCLGDRRSARLARQGGGCSPVCSQRRRRRGRMSSWSGFAVEGGSEAVKGGGDFLFRGWQADRSPARYDRPTPHAGVAELADAQDLKSWVPKGRAGSIPAPGTSLRLPAAPFAFPRQASARQASLRLPSAGQSRGNAAKPRGWARWAERAAADCGVSRIARQARRPAG